VDVAGDLHPFTMRKWESEGSILNGNTNASIYENVLVGLTTYWTTVDNPATQTNAYYAASVLARTNPSRASVDAVVAGIELREIPGLVKDSYKIATDKLFKFIPRRAFRALSKIAKLNLMVQFGILPLVSDIKKLQSFQDAVKQRSKEVERLKTRGLRRTIQLDSASQIRDNLINHFSAAGIVHQIACTKLTTVNVRGHVRWHATSSLPIGSLEEQEQIKKALLGLTVDPLTLYELMPWSWLIDWFSNLGNIVKATRNIIPASHSTPTIMRHTLSTAKQNRVTFTHPSISISPVSCVAEQKLRQSSVASLSAHFGMLEANQMSILASLSILKAR